MKLIAALLLIGATSTPTLAAGPIFRGQKNTYHESFCYKNTEEYIPGYYNKYGQYVGGYVKYRTKKVRCRDRYVPNYAPHPRHEEQHPNMGSEDNNSCIEGSILGGIAGGGLGAALSRNEGRLWAIPLGIVGGAIAGCQVDGG